MATALLLATKHRLKFTGRMIIDCMGRLRGCFGCSGLLSLLGFSISINKTTGKRLLSACLCRYGGLTVLRAYACSVP